MRRYVLVLLLLLFPAMSYSQQCTQNQLSTEFVSDPTGRGYPTCAPEDDQCVLVRFNSPCADQNCKIEQVITKEALYEVIDSAEYLTLLRSTAANDVARVRALDHALTNASLNMAVKEVRDKLLDIFPAPSAPITNAAIVALQHKNAPRSQIVCSRPATLADVSCGRRGDGC